MAKEGKRSIGKIVLIVVVVLVVVGALGSMGGNKTTTTAPESTQQTEQSDAKDQSATEQKTEESTENLVIGTTVNLPDGLSVTVDSVEPGLANYDGSAMTGIHVTYTNNGNDGASYNVFDWKGEDANGAQQSSGYYSDGSDELSSGTLAKGGTVSGNVYFKDDLARVLYFGNVLEKTATASWALS